MQGGCAEAVGGCGYAEYAGYAGYAGYVETLSLWQRLHSSRVEP